MAGLSQTWIFPPPRPALMWRWQAAVQASYTAPFSSGRSFQPYACKFRSAQPTSINFLSCRFYCESQIPPSITASAGKPSIASNKVSRSMPVTRMVKFMRPGWSDG